MLTRQIGSAYSSVLRTLDLEPRKNLDPETNGEYAFLRRLSTFPEINRYECAIDIGAHRGEWTTEAMKAFSGTSITTFYCVEPMPHLAKALRQTFAENGNVTVIEAAMTSSADETISIYDVGGAGRLYPSYRNANRREAGGQKTVANLRVRGVSGDDLFADSKPGMIKVDCEGHDLHVLQSLHSVLTTARPAIQFEYSEYWIAAGSRLREAARFFRNLDYRIYRLFPHRLLPIRYGPVLDTYEYQNIIAAPAEWKSIDKEVRF
jgi:FkbM family methyltransferase